MTARGRIVLLRVQNGKGISDFGAQSGRRTLIRLVPAETENFLTGSDAGVILKLTDSIILFLRWLADG